jgi:hypothetical protein
MAVPNAKVKKLQQALATYATVTGYAAANPGAADGFVGVRTINAVIAMIPLLPKMPSEIKALATIGPLIMIDNDARAKAAKFITDNADKITSGVIGLAAYQAGTGKLPTQTPTPTPTQLPVGPTAQPGYQPSYPAPMPSAAPWYASGWGVATIVGGVLGVISIGALLFSRRG